MVLEHGYELFLEIDQILSEILLLGWLTAFDIKRIDGDSAFCGNSCERYIETVFGDAAGQLVKQS